MEHLLQKAIVAAADLGAEYAEARFQIIKDHGYTLKNGILEPPSLGFDKGISLRVAVKGCLGFAATNVLEEHSVLSLAKESVKMSKAADRLSWKIHFSDEHPVKAEWAAPIQKPFSDIPIEDKIDMLKEIDGSLIENRMPVNLPTRFLSFHEDKETSEYLNGEGTEIRSTVSRVNFSAFLTAYKPSFGSTQRMVLKGGSGGWEVVEDWNLRETIQREGELLGEILVKGKKPPIGKIDLILGPEVVGIICHESCGHPQEADRVLGREAAQAGKSYLNPDMIGHRVGSQQVTIVDDPTLKTSYGYYEFDDEGVKARERMLIKEGVIKNFLHNRATACEFGIKSNGSSRSAGYDKEPIVRMANTYMKPGDYKPEELVEKINHGVFIKNFMEWNIDDRRFHQRYVGLESYIIEKGELKDLIKNPVLEITTPGLYGSVDAVSDKVEFEAAICGKGDPMQPIPVWHGGPAIRLRNVRLGG